MVLYMVLMYIYDMHVYASRISTIVCDACRSQLLSKEGATGKNRQILLKALYDKLSKDLCWDFDHNSWVRRLAHYNSFMYHECMLIL